MAESFIASKNTSPQSSPSLERSLMIDLMGLIVFSFGLLCLFSLLSYTPEDLIYPSHGNLEVANWIGPGGALLANGFLTFLGLGGFLVPFVLLGLSYNCFKQRFYTVKPQQLLGVSMVFLSMLLLFEQNTWLQKWLHYPAGGILGRVLETTLRIYFYPLGTLILTFTFLSIGLLLLPAWPNLKLPKWPAKQTQKKPISPPPSEQVSEQVTAHEEPKTQETWELPQNLDNFHIVETPHIPLATLNEPPAAAKENQAYQMPTFNLLNYDAPEGVAMDEERMRSLAIKLEETFGQFDIQGHVREVRPGPVVTCFEYVPAPGIKLSKIASLADDIAMAMEAIHVRVVAPIPGKGAVGIEIPNDHRQTVYLKEIVADPHYRKQTHPLCMAVGKTIEGNPYFMNLAHMPHVLMAGTTGSGKSVSVNAMICSILYRASPEDVRFIMIDPKMLELSIYDGIPHLLIPPIVDSKKAALSLKWAVGEMEFRYQKMNQLGVRDIEGYNEKVKNFNDPFHEHQKMPFIVIVVDEYADLVMVAGKEVEAYVMRLAQKARACGIHVMLATQRPSVDIITGVIKANFPVRMGFRLASAHDSKTIINRSGAEKLLGRGDMLIIPPGTSELTRVHGAYISEKELNLVIDFWRSQQAPSYDMRIQATLDESSDSSSDLDLGEEQDDKYKEAVAVVKQTQKCSTSWLQRQLGIGYNRAARMVDRMEKEGLVGPIQNAKGDREIFS